MLINKKATITKNQNVSKGSVTMTLEAYNEMLLIISKYEKAITLKGKVSEWSNKSHYSIELDFDYATFKKIIQERLLDIDENIIDRLNEEEIDWDYIGIQRTLVSKEFELIPAE